MSRDVMAKKPPGGHPRCGSLMEVIRLFAEINMMAALPLTKSFVIKLHKKEITSQMVTFNNLYKEISASENATTTDEVTTDEGKINTLQYTKAEDPQV